jgi:hypothetical protein
VRPETYHVDEVRRRWAQERIARLGRAQAYIDPALESVLAEHERLLLAGLTEDGQAALAQRGGLASSWQSQEVVPVSWMHAFVDVPVEGVEVARSFWSSVLGGDTA